MAQIVKNYTRFRIAEMTTAFDPHQYALDHGWDFSCVEATARLGIAEEDEIELEETPGAARELLRWCREKVSQE